MELADSAASDGRLRGEKGRRGGVIFSRGKGGEEEGGEEKPGVKGLKCEIDHESTSLRWTGSNPAKRYSGVDSCGRWTRARRVWNRYVLCFLSITLFPSMADSSAEMQRRARGVQMQTNTAVAFGNSGSHTQSASSQNSYSFSGCFVVATKSTEIVSFGETIAVAALYSNNAS